MKPSSLCLRYLRLKTWKEEESSHRGVVDGLKERVVVDQRVVVDHRVVVDQRVVVDHRLVDHSMGRGRVRSCLAPPEEGGEEEGDSTARSHPHTD